LSQPSVIVEREEILPVKNFHVARTGQAAVLFLAALTAAQAQTVRPYTIFASGTDKAVQATGPDSITVGRHSVWVSYTNGAESHGLNGGKSTIVRYDLDGGVKHVFSIAGSVDGLKFDQRTGLVWAMQNQDGNSTLTLIDAEDNTLSAALAYAVPAALRGYDDVVFHGNQVFLSYTNPTNGSDPTIQLVESLKPAIKVSTILTMGATGTDLATGKKNQATSQNDPDSLKSTPTGGLMLTSGDDGQLIFVENPGKPTQSVAFLNVLDTGGNGVTGLDDAVFVTAEKGTFYLTDTGNNRVITFQAEDLKPGSLFACVGSLNQFVKVDLKTGMVTALVTHLSAPHGLVFVPQSDEGEGEQGHDR
jgi:hypothetical protein